MHVYICKGSCYDIVHRSEALYGRLPPSMQYLTVFDSASVQLHQLRECVTDTDVVVSCTCIHVHVQWNLCVTDTSKTN